MRWVGTTRVAWTFIVMMMTMTMTMKMTMTMVMVMVMTVKTTTTWAMETMETAETTERTATAMDGRRTKNYFSTLDERELFDALRERTVVLGLFVPHCELCAAYVDEF